MSSRKGFSPDVNHLNNSCMKKSAVLFLSAFLTFFIFQSANAISFTGSYSENFDSLLNTGTPTWANDSTLPGWSLFDRTGNSLTTSTYATGNGSSGTGSFYSFGTTASSDRALGGLASGGAYFGSPASGAVAGYIAVALLNTSGITFGSITISFDGEQWRNGGNTAAQTMQLQYGFGSTFAGVSTWNTPGGSFDWTSPVTGATAAAVDGNSAGKVAGVGGTLSGLPWNNGDTLWVRWIENNDTGNDHGLAIDNFSVAASVVSAPEQTSTFALAALVVCACFAFGRKAERLV